MIHSALRPATDMDNGLSVRLLHEQYDRLFKSVVTGGWCDSSDGNVEAPCGYFSIITIERNECKEFWEANCNEDTLTEGQLVWMWPGQLAGYYITTEDSNGIIRVWAYDDRDEAVRSYAGLESQYEAWDGDELEQPFPRECSE